MTAVGYVGGDPSKVDVDGYTQGDVLAADSSGTLTPVPIGTVGQALSVDPVEDTLVDWETGGGVGAVASVFGRTGAVIAVADDYTLAQITGLVAALAAKATKPIVRQSRITSGSITPPNTTPTWNINATLNAPPIPAAVGDFVEVSITALLGFSSSMFLDIAVISGASIVRYMGSGTATPLVEGNPGLYPTSSSFAGKMCPQGFVVEAGDLDGSNVQFALVSKAAGTGTILATAAYPLQWLVKNLGAVA